jgi:hypothetical protein
MVYTGAVPIVYKARRTLLDGLVLGFGTDVLLVVVSVVLLMRNSSSGLLLFLTQHFSDHDRVRFDGLVRLGHRHRLGDGALRRARREH